MDIAATVPRCLDTAEKWRMYLYNTLEGTKAYESNIEARVCDRLGIHPEQLKYEAEQVGLSICNGCGWWYDCTLDGDCYHCEGCG